MPIRLPVLHALLASIEKGLHACADPTHVRAIHTLLQSQLVASNKGIGQKGWEKVQKQPWQLRSKRGRQTDSTMQVPLLDGGKADVSL